MAKELCRKDRCRKLAKEILDAGRITGMTQSQLFCEIYAHAYVCYHFYLLPKVLRKLPFLRSVQNSASNGVDLQDNGDTWYRRIAYRLIWILPHKRI